MSNLKKTAAAVLALASSAVFAGTMGPVCTPGNVTVPCETSAWDIGIYALYLEPVYDTGMGYMDSFLSTYYYDTYYPGYAYRWDNDDNWRWGFKLEGSYHFGTGNDININWYHLTNDHDLDDNDNYYNYYYNHHRNVRWDAVNFEFGQHVDMGEMYNIRIHAGAQYARIRSNFDMYYWDTITDPYNGSYKLDLNAFGPRVGLDTSYNLGNGFSIYGNGAVALLVGSHKHNNGYYYGSNYYDYSLLSDTYAYDYSNYNHSRHHIVPELEAKLGARYTFGMAQGALSIDGGWMWVDYINARNVHPVSHGDFAVQGPYLGLKWIGNV